jgi:hypothetical protein
MMNERIQKLYKETTGKDWVYDFDPDYAGKFAELIVRECAGVSENHKGMNDKYFIADAIKKHFEIEE